MQARGFRGFRACDRAKRRSQHRSHAARLRCPGPGPGLDADAGPGPGPDAGPDPGLDAGPGPGPGGTGSRGREVTWGRPGGSVRRISSFRGAARRGRAAGPRGAASRGRAAAPLGVACDHGAAWEVAADRRGHTAPARDRPGSSPAGSQDAAEEVQPGRAAAGPGSSRRPALLESAGVRRSAGFPGCSDLRASRARDCPWAHRAGRPVSIRSSASARAVDPNALRCRARRDRCLRSERQPGAGPGCVPMTDWVLMTGCVPMTYRALGPTPRFAGGQFPAGDPPYPRAARTFRLSRS
jgi:hypothetical protein